MKEYLTTNCYFLKIKEKARYVTTTIIAEILSKIMINNNCAIKIEIRFV